MSRRLVRVAVLGLVLSLCKAALAQDDAALIRQNTLATLKAIVQEDKVTEAVATFSDVVQFEFRQNGAPTARAFGRKAVEEFIRTNRPAGTLGTTDRMIHVAVMGEQAAAVIDFKFTMPNGEVFQAVLLLDLVKADGKWLATRIVLCDNPPGE